ncbi:MAG TPA: hypothetical protein VLQ45_27190 [Thermoanaerobaculia bacterium]|nr:hypothetical protein [Thermoanaerobaculia bacterium]
MNPRRLAFLAAVFLLTVPPAGAETPVIRILAAYTPAAGSGERLGKAVEETNLRFEKLGVTPRLELAHAVPVDYEEARTRDPLGTDLERLHGKTDGYLYELHALRDAYEADLLVLLVGDAANDRDCGRVHDAFLVLEAGCADAPGTLTRQLALLAGIPEDDPAAWNAQGEILARFRSPVAVTLTCDGRGPRFDCHAAAEGGSGPYLYQWSFRGEGTLTAEGTHAGIAMAPDCDAEDAAPFVWVTVKDATTATTYASRSLGCWAEAH